MIKYHPAPDIETRARHIAEKTGMEHDFSRIKFLRSTGSQATRTLARCHAMPRVLQAALEMKAHYVIEVIAEQFDKMSEEQKTKTIIHELLHVPKSMGGGFRYHDYVCNRNIEQMYKMLKNS
ncbi:MAG TPA: putative metallopeptidase [archaeon]|nr:putative metallopeptidase [archaeon]